MKSISESFFFRALIIVFCGTLVGCASVTMPAPTASATTVEKLRTANLTPAGVGKFGPAAGARPDIDRALGGLRGSSVSAASGSFSQQLKDVIVTELKAAGLYDEKSIFQIDGQLTESEVDAAIGTGTARLAAIFSVKKGDQRLFEKTLSVDSKWESSFVGAIAIPAAINQYTSLYKELAAKLFDDRDFRSILAR